MNISYYVKLYGLTAPIFFVIDLIWLGVAAKGFYQKNLKYILSPNVNWTAAILFYLIYIAGILIFAVLPAVTKDSLRHAALWGALFGFFLCGSIVISGRSRRWFIRLSLTGQL